MVIAAALAGAWLGLGSPQPSEASSEDSEAAREARSVKGGWISINPLGVGVPGPGDGPDLRVLNQAIVAGYRWGFSAGLSFEPLDHLMVSAAVAVDQTVWIFDDADDYELCFRGDCHGWTERGLGHFTRFGADLRVGFSNRWLLAWVLGSVHIGLSRIRLECDNSVQDHCGKGETDLGPGIGGGAGLAYRVTPYFALGLETSIDHSWLETFNDPFRSVRTWDLAMIAIVRF